VAASREFRKTNREFKPRKDLSSRIADKINFDKTFQRNNEYKSPENYLKLNK
jgi:hypothetical protein